MDSILLPEAQNPKYFKPFKQNISMIALLVIPKKWGLKKILTL